jgi:hypothetical protein
MSVTFLLQVGPVMTSEKVICVFSNYSYKFCKYEDLKKIPTSRRFEYVPVGSVEWTCAYCQHVGITLPPSISYLGDSHLHRKVRKGQYHEAGIDEFVKPVQTKIFTGNLKRALVTEQPLIDPNTEVWISEPVTFESEFRFYIHDYAHGPEIKGWARYDDLSIDNPDPDHELVRRIAAELHSSLGPGAYSIDIGWRPDLQRYTLVELNDGWSLGYYAGMHSPTRQQYADMLVDRWLQILLQLPLNKVNHGL